MGGMMISRPPVDRGFQLMCPVYPSIVTLVCAVLTGAPRLRVLLDGQSRAMANTSVPFLVYLKQNQCRYVEYIVLTIWFDTLTCMGIA